MFVNILHPTEYPSRSYFESRLTQLSTVENLLIDRLTVKSEFFDISHTTQCLDGEVTSRTAERSFAPKRTY